MTEVYILLYAENIPFLHVSGRDADFSIKEYLLTRLVEMSTFSQPHLFFFSLQQQPALHSFPLGQGVSSSPLPMPCTCCCLPQGYPCFPISLWSPIPLPARDLIPGSASRGSGLSQYESTWADSIKYQKLGSLNNGNIFLSFGGRRVQNQVPEDLGVWWVLYLFRRWLPSLCVSSHGLSLVRGWKDLSLPLLIRLTLSRTPAFRLHLNLINS